MSLDQNTAAHLVIPQERSGPWRGILVVAVLAGVGMAAWGLGLRPSRLWASAPSTLEVVTVDRGDVDLMVVENGSLESADNATARCQVEALIGLVGGTQGNAQGGAQGAQGARGGAQGGAAGAAGGGQTQQQMNQQQQQLQDAAKKKGQPQSKPGQRKMSAKSASKGSAGGANAAGGVNAAGGASGGQGGAAGGQGAANPNGTPVANVQRPVIRSFTMMVTPHVPLRPKSANPGQQTKAQQKTQAAGGASGSRGGGGSRRGSTDPSSQEKAGATRIISILPEGTLVKAGDIVCELDSSAFRDELQAQEIRFLQSQAWVEQAQSILEVCEISLAEYRDGIYPQDVQLIRQYNTTCKTENERARRNFEWSRAMAEKGFRASAQVKADEASMMQTEIALREAEGMSFRLEKYTAPRLIKTLEAKVEAVRSDKLTQEAAFQLDNARRKKLKDMVDYCTIRAPRDGLVVYANQANIMGRVTTQIAEGVTVHQGQPIFQLPNPNHMQVRAKINESKVSYLRTGQPTTILIDAFPGRPLRGTVKEITAIPAPANGPSDVRVYFATVAIDTGGFADLRPGLSAEVIFQIETKRQVSRVPLEAIRWVDRKPFAAVATLTETGTKWHWKPVSLGLSDSTYAQVLSGLEPGDHVVAQPAELPPPQTNSAG